MPASVASGCAAATMPRVPSATGRCAYPICGIISDSREELRDLVLGEGGQRLAPAAAHQREALGALHDLADEVTVDVLARERVDDGGRVAGRERHEERPDAIVPSGSRPNASQSARPSGSTMI